MFSQKLSKTLAIILIAISLIATSTVPSIAVPSNHDYFSRTTEKKSLASLNTHVPSMTKFDTAKNWFGTFDEIVETRKPSSSERVILGRPLNQDITRVAEWTRVARKVSNDYRQLSSTIRNIPVPNTVSEIREFRNLTADWYADAAQIFSDLITPRAPARTMEELESQLKDIHDRSQNLVQTNSTLQMMDNDIRQKYDVPSALSNDPIRKYAQFKPHED